MLIGLTYDLREEYLRMGYSEEETAEFDKEDTIEAIEDSLHKLGHQTQRIGHLRQLMTALLKGDRWEMVFNICEGMHGIGREAQVPALLDAYQIPYVFSGPVTLSLTLGKGMTKRIIRDAGIPTADFELVSDKEDLTKLSLPYPLFVKPVAEGTGKGINAKSVIHTSGELHNQVLFLLKQFKQPVLVETYLTGREFTVGITGTAKEAAATGVMEIILNERAEQGVYSYENKENWRDRVSYRNETGGELGKCCEKIALDAWRVLGVEDGGRVDIRLDSSGIPNFIEVNPLPGLNPSHSDLPMLSRMNGIDFDQLMERIIASAIKKIPQ